jgi:hypothetical protein
MKKPLTIAYLLLFCCALHAVIAVAKPRTPGKGPNWSAQTDANPDGTKTILYDPNEVQVYVSYLKNNAKNPVDYVMELFAGHDLVVLGERTHPEATQWDFIYELTSDPRFIEDVGHIFTEYGSVEQQPSLEKFMAAENLQEKDIEQRTIEILRNFPIWPTGWTNNNFYDYMKKLYRLNQSLAVDKRIKLYFSDVPWQWEGKNKEDYEVFWKTVIPNRDRIMADRIDSKFREILKSDSKTKKALVVMNTRHAYKVGPDTNNDLFRKFPHNNTGAFLIEKSPGRLANVMLNTTASDIATGPGREYDTRRVHFPIQNGKWDAAFWMLGNSPLGFNFEGSPFGKDGFDLLCPLYSQYKYEDVFTGMVFYQPLGKHTVAESIPGYYSDEFKQIVLKRAKVKGDENYYNHVVKIFEVLGKNPNARAKRKQCWRDESGEDWCRLEFKTATTVADARRPNKELNRPTPVDVRDIDEANWAPYLAYLKDNTEPPIEYVLGKFRDYDVVILGEMHEVRENLELVRDLIEPMCHQAGVKCFAIETLKSKNNSLVNKLVTAPEYDQQLALQLFRDAHWPFWGFKEYMDIVKAVWEVNRALPLQAERLKVVGLEQDWDAHDRFFGSREKPDEERDEHMATVFAQEVLKKGEKALILIGFSHSFTHYRQPILKDGKLVDERARFAYTLYQEYGDKIFQICLHLRHAGRETLTGGKGEPDPILIDFLERILQKAGNRPAGFDIQNSPFANLRDRQSSYFAFQPDVVFSDVTRGYIFLKPLKKLSKITWVTGFIDASNFEKAKAVAEKRGWIKEFEKKGLIKPGQCDTPEGLDRLFKMLFESG